MYKLGLGVYVGRKWDKVSLELRNRGILSDEKFENKQDVRSSGSSQSYLSYHRCTYTVAAAAAAAAATVIPNCQGQKIERQTEGDPTN
jgi:hypothetical protein